MMRFAYKNSEGRVCLVMAAPKEALAPLLGKRNAEGDLIFTDADYRQHVLSRSIPKDATDLIELPDDWKAPSDRSLRHAWTIKGGRVVVDEALARNPRQGPGNN